MRLLCNPLCRQRRQSQVFLTAQAADHGVLLRQVMVGEAGLRSNMSLFLLIPHPTTSHQATYLLDITLRQNSVDVATLTLLGLCNAPITANG